MCDAVERPEKLEAAVRGPRLTAVDEHPEHLDPVERHAAGALHDPADDVAQAGRGRVRAASSAIASSGSGSRWIAVNEWRPAPHVGRMSSSSGRASVTIRMGWARDQVARWSTKSSRAGIGPLHVGEDEDRRRPVRDALEEPPPGREELVPLEPRPQARVEQGGQARLDPVALLVVGHELLERSSELAPGDLRLGPLADPRAAAHHLDEGRERVALAVRGGPPDVQRQRFGQRIEVTLELPGQTALADPRDADHRDDPATPRRDGPREEVGKLRELCRAADERPRVACCPPFRLTGDAERTPGADRPALSLEGQLTDRLEGDRLADQPPRRVVDEHRVRWRGRLESCRRVDEVAGDHALAIDAEGDCRDAGPDRRTCA